MYFLSKVYHFSVADLYQFNIAANRAYWAYDLPESLKEFRSNSAVLVEWNQDGYYVKYIVEQQEGIPVWEGKVAEQHLGDHLGPKYNGWYLAGGGNQIYIPNPEQVIPEGLEIHSTPWSK